MKAAFVYIYINQIFNMKSCLSSALFAVLLLSAISSRGQKDLQAITGRIDGREPHKINLYSSAFSIPLTSFGFTINKVAGTATAFKAAAKLINDRGYTDLIDSLLDYRKQFQLNDWMYYQLLRSVAQQLYQKEADYNAYTLFKWFLMCKSGYDAQLALSGQNIIFYVYNNEDIADIPFFMVEGKKYMCLNYHDYANATLQDHPPVPLNLKIPGATKAFSNRVTHMPEFKSEDYKDKELAFVYDQQQYHFIIRQNTMLEKLFINYPGVDFETYFNIPLSRETYSSLIPLLKHNIRNLNQKKGVDYLMRFTRYAFLYENDQQNFGREKRMSPELTLSSAYSDCDDRVALFFYLVKEIYNLPMIALLYPSHITMAVAFSQPVGEPIIYNGKIYSMCEPTPEKEDNPIGRFAANLKNVPYQVVYQYQP
jgi:hypothetical protein